MLSIIGKGKDARNLANALDCKRFNKKANMFIRYGNVREGFEGIQINSIEAINNARDKLYTLTMLSENGIRVPEFGLEFETATKPFFARERYHKKGKDIEIYKSEDIIDYKHLRNTKHYWIKYIPVNSEYRVHVMNDTVIQICKKIPNDDTHENDMIRNLEHGWHFAEARNWENGYNKLKEMAIASVKILGLDFGAVDIILGKDKNYYVLEVNTAPGLDNKRLDLYVENFLRLILLKQRPNRRIRARLVLPKWFKELVIDFYDGFEFEHNLEPTDEEQGLEFLRRFFQHIKEDKDAKTVFEGNRNDI